MGKLKQDYTIRCQRTGALPNYNKTVSTWFKAKTVIINGVPKQKTFQGKTYKVSSVMTVDIVTGKLLKSVDIWEEVL